MPQPHTCDQRHRRNGGRGQVLGLLLLMLVAMVMMWPKVIMEEQINTVERPVFACHSLHRLSWTEMDAAQQQLARSCDEAEAHQQWEAAYGRMEVQEWALAAVHEPL